MNGFYVSTAISYSTARPTLGHALELVQADVLARRRRHRGQPVRFQTGTDENAQKNVRAARAAGRDVAEFVAANAERFAELTRGLSLLADDFIRTSSHPRHARGVERLWQHTAANGDLYRRRYTGLYCPTASGSTRRPSRPTAAARSTTPPRKPSPRRTGSSGSAATPARWRPRSGPASQLGRAAG